MRLSDSLELLQQLLKYTQPGRVANANTSLHQQLHAKLASNYPQLIENVNLLEV